MTVPRTLPECHALWVGPGLGALERACLGSFVEAGHPVRLHAYEPLEGVPRGIEVRDAAEILPRDAVVRHRATGSVSLFSNWFRYEVLRRGLGVWIDADVLCLRALDDAPWLFGFQDRRRVNGAVLRLPAGHPVLDDLAAIFTTPRWVPPWLRIDRRLRCAVRHRLRRGYGLPDMPWGTAGPEALTWYLARHGLLARALPTDVLYPVPYREVGGLLLGDPRSVCRRLTPRTRCVHLWHQGFGPAARVPPPGSFLHAVAEGRWREVLSPVPGAEGRGAAVGVRSPCPTEPPACASPSP